MGKTLATDVSDTSGLIFHFLAGVADRDPWFHPSIVTGETGMRLLLRSLFVVALISAGARIGWAQAPSDPSEPPPIPQPRASGTAAGGAPQGVGADSAKEFETRQVELE